MRFKKILACAAALSICLSGFAQFEAVAPIYSIVSAKSYSEIEGIEYTVLDDGTVEISKYTGHVTKLDIPKEIDGKKVTVIGGMAFMGCTTLTSVSFPDSITKILPRSFLGCQNLSDITFPESNIYIGENAFGGTKWINKQREKDEFVIINNNLICTGTFQGGVAVIPDGITFISDYAFFECAETLTGISFPDSVTSIGYYAFAQCTRLTDIVLHDSVTSIGMAAFENCSSLTSITILDNVTKIDPDAFKDCDKLTIYGCKDSCAQKYAKENDIPFKVIDSETTPPENNNVVTTTVTETTTPVTTTKVTETTTSGNKEVVKADIDKDGKISVIDLIRFKVHMFSGKENSDLSVWDINDDGKFNILDYIYFLELFTDVNK